MIELPDTIKEADADLTCAYLPQKFNENFFNLLLTKDENVMNCEISNSIVRISSVNTLMDSLTADDFLRVAIYKLKNANISTWGHHYDITFLDSSTGTGSVVSTGQVSTPYRISPTPLNIQFNDITVASQKFFVLNRYQFSMETVNGEDIQINGDSRIGILITFPDEYKKIWETIDKPSKVYITFGSTDYEDVPEMVLGSLIVKFKVTSEVSFSSLSVAFDFRNPITALDCSVLPVFTLSILDFKLNAILAETLSNNIECPEFKDSLYGINITGNLKIQAGEIETFTIKLEEPAYFLNITPVSPTPTITFHPSSIVFRNYSET